MRLGAERGIKRYIDHLDDIEDAKSLGIVRKNLEMKQGEIEWYDEQGAKEREQILDTKLETGKEKIKLAEAEEKDGKKGGLPFPLLVAAGAAVGAAYFLMRKGEESDYEDYGEDAFRYEEEGATSGAADVTGGSFDTYSAGNMDNAPLS
jgi:hypothetical protein